MQIFIAAVSVALIVSFLCSMFESVLLSINYCTYGWHDGCRRYL